MDHRLMIVLTFLLVVLVVVILNFWSWMAHGSAEQTVSSNIALWAKQWKIIAFAAGVVVGHLFNDMDTRPALILGVAIGWLFW